MEDIGNYGYTLFRTTPITFHGEWTKGFPDKDLIVKLIPLNDCHTR